jgi:tetratricopeptide (TPR) repeat protein
MLSRLTPLVKLFYNPFQAMTELAARRPYFFGAALALISTFLYYDVLNGDLRRIISIYERLPVAGLATRFAWLVSQLFSHIIAIAPPVLFLIVVFVPACLLAASLVERRASFRVLLQREYGGLVSCALYGWTVAHLLTLIPALFIYEPPQSNLAEILYGARHTNPPEALRLVPLFYFVLLVMVALKRILRLDYGRAIGTVALASLSLVAIPLLSRFLFLLTSPLLLILVIILLRNFFDDIATSHRARENFERNLEASTLNPADASAHYNLGLIYQQRGQYEEAKACFRRAVEIRPDEVDAHYQLGRIAREEGRLAEAISHFDAVVREHAEHSQSEVWREIGHTYFQAGQLEDARAALERFIAKRPSDAEGRYRYGLTLAKLGRREEATDEMRACIEAVRTSPAYKYRADKRWMDEAESFLRSDLRSS